MKGKHDDLSSSRAIRTSQIILGAIAIVLSLVIIAEPMFGITTLIFLLSLTLLVEGLERVAAGSFLHIAKSSRIGNIILGVITIGLGFAVIIFPLMAAISLVTLLSVGLFLLGIARILHGITNKNISQLSRAFLIGVGILSLAISSIVFAHPISGIILLTIILAVNLLIIGIEIIVHGASGRKNVIPSSSADQAEIK
jgi:uncharacterized membrane protein HdeD (DUF308 family)